MAQLVSASGLGPEGPVFESQYPDIIQKQLLETQVVAFSLSPFSSFWIYPGRLNGPDTAQRKKSVDLHFLHHRHKAGGASPLA